MPALLQYDRGFQTGNPASGDQDGFCFFRLIDLALRFPSYGRIPKAGDLRAVHIRKAVQTSLVASDTIVDLFHQTCFCLVAEFRVCKLCPAHDNHIHFVFFQDLFRKLRRIDASYANCQHSGFLPDTGCIFYIKSLWKINWRHFILIRR